jgi:hypothetical protein
VKFLRLDEAGENYASEKECMQQNLAIKFEYSGPCTPQKMERLNANFNHCMVEFEQLWLQILSNDHIVRRLAVGLIDGCHPLNFATGGEVYQ